MAVDVMTTTGPAQYDNRGRWQVVVDVIGFQVSESDNLRLQITGTLSNLSLTEVTLAHMVTVHSLIWH